MAEKYDARIEIRLTRQQKHTLIIRAQQAGMDISEWIRRRCLADVAIRAASDQIPSLPTHTKPRPGSHCG